MTEAERRAALERVAAEVRDCTRCRLHEGRTQAVPGEGHASTEVLFVGEGPGLNEDRQGRPFVGAAGQFLTELLGSVGWRREDVFITNVVKCRPPQNRDPEPDEIEACAPYLRRQLDALDPALVVTLGRHSMGRFMPGARIGQVHGTSRPGPTELGADRALVFAMYHPAAALHQGSLRQTLLDDMAQVPRALIEARRRRSVQAEPAATTVAVAPPATPDLQPPATELKDRAAAVKLETDALATDLRPADPAAERPHAEVSATPGSTLPRPAPAPVEVEVLPTPVEVEAQSTPIAAGSAGPADDRSPESLDLVAEPMLGAVAAAGDQAPSDDQMTLF